MRTQRLPLTATQELYSSPAAPQPQTSQTRMQTVDKSKAIAQFHNALIYATGAHAPHAGAPARVKDDWWATKRSHLRANNPDALHRCD